MWILIFSGVLVGLPAGFGTYMIVDKSADSKSSTGFMLLLFAFVLGGFFAYLLPEGKLVSANFQLKMPAVFVLGCVIGGVAGFLNRGRSGR